MALQVGTASEIGLDSANLRRFYGENWKRPTALSDDAFYAWQFTDGPDAEGRDGCVVAYDADAGKIAGVLGLTPRKFYLAGKPRVAAELTTWIVRDEYRTSGVGVPMLGLAMSKYDVLMAMGISQFSLPVFLRSGFRYLRACPRFLTVFDFDAVASIGVVAPLARKLSRSRSQNMHGPGSSVTPGLPERTEELFSRVHGRFSMFARDLRHLDWRYARHPSFIYHTFLVEKGRHAAFVALRLEDAVPGVRIVHVTDLVGDDEAMPAAFNFVEGWCRDHGASMADFYSAAATLARYPLALGWFSALDDLELRVPHLFRPVEMRDPPTTSLTYWSREDFLSLCDHSNLYITKSDIDFDRPVPAASRIS